MSEIPSNLREPLRTAGVDLASVRVLLRTPEGEIFGTTTSSGQAVPHWKCLREALRGADYIPVILGDEEHLNLFREAINAPDASTVGEVLKEARTIDVGNWLTVRHDELVDELMEFGGDLYHGADEGFKSEPREAYRGIPRGAWPDNAEPTSDFAIANSPPGQPIFVGLLQTSVPWEIPAFLRFGHFNWCPPTAVHVALMKHWHEVFGAEIVVLQRDTVEALVSRPLSSQSAAMRLAREQYLYCQDIVDQGTETIEALVATLLGGKTWFFWWD